MITWSELKETLDKCPNERLSDVATVFIDDELVPIDLLQIECPEINDDRLVATLLHDIEVGTYEDD